VKTGVQQTTVASSGDFAGLSSPLIMIKITIAAIYRGNVGINDVKPNSINFCKSSASPPLSVVGAIPESL
jgi:hypothetical protein